MSNKCPTCKSLMRIIEATRCTGPYGCNQTDFKKEQCTNASCRRKRTTNVPCDCAKKHDARMKKVVGGK